jgi:hypothetical protein
MLMLLRMDWSVGTDRFSISQEPRATLRAKQITAAAMAQQLPRSGFVQ